MVTYYCPECGEEMVKDDYDDDYYCDNCMCYFSIPKDQEKFFKNPLTHLIQDIFSCIDDNRPGPGCRACGNPSYPKCKDSCPLFDD